MSAVPKEIVSAACMVMDSLFRSSSREEIITAFAEAILVEANKAFFAGYLEGFEHSGEGYNHEYGCDNPEDDASWIKERQRCLARFNGEIA